MKEELTGNYWLHNMECIIKFVPDAIDDVIGSH